MKKKAKPMTAVDITNAALKKIGKGTKSAKGQLNITLAEWSAKSFGKPNPMLDDMLNALDVQEGGDHYKKLAIQPAEFVHANRIPYLEGSVIYYVTRWRDKNGIADLKKARHTIDLIIELENQQREGED